MRDVVSTSGVSYRSVEMEWQQFREWRGGGVGRVRLLKCWTLIGKTPDAAVASEVVIERTVFLDQDDHVIDVAQTSGVMLKYPDSTQLLPLQCTRRHLAPQTL